MGDRWTMDAAALSRAVASIQQEEQFHDAPADEHFFDEVELKQPADLQAMSRADLEQYLLQLQEKLEESQVEVLTLRQRLESQTELQALQQRDFQQQKQADAETFARERDLLVQQLQEQESELVALRTGQPVAASSTPDSQAEIERLQIQIRGLKEEEDRRISAHIQELSQWRRRLAEATATAAEPVAQVNEGALLQERAAHQAEVQALQDQIKHLAETQHQLEVDNADLQGRVAMLTQTITEHQRVSTHDSSPPTRAASSDRLLLRISELEQETAQLHANEQSLVQAQATLKADLVAAITDRDMAVEQLTQREMAHQQRLRDLEHQHQQQHQLLAVSSSRSARSSRAHSDTASTMDSGDFVDAEAGDDDAVATMLASLAVPRPGADEASSAPAVAALEQEIAHLHHQIDWEKKAAVQLRQQLDDVSFARNQAVEDALLADNRAQAEIAQLRGKIAELEARQLDSDAEERQQMVAKLTELGVGPREDPQLISQTQRQHQLEEEVEWLREAKAELEQQLAQLNEQRHAEREHMAGLLAESERKLASTQFTISDLQQEKERLERMQSSQTQASPFGSTRSLPLPKRDDPSAASSGSVSPSAQSPPPTRVALQSAKSVDPESAEVVQLLQSQLDSLRLLHSNLQISSEAELRQMQDELRAAESLIQQHESEISKLRQQVAAQEADHRQQIAHLEQQYQQQFAQREAHRVAPASSEPDSLRALLQQSEEQMRQFQTAEAQAQQQTHLLLQQLEQERGAAAADLQQREQLLSQMREEVAASRAALEAADQRQRSLTDLLHQSQAETASVRQQLQFAQEQASAAPQQTAEQQQLLSELQQCRGRVQHLEQEREVLAAQLQHSSSQAAAARTMAEQLSQQDQQLQQYERQRLLNQQQLEEQEQQLQALSRQLEQSRGETVAALAKHEHQPDLAGPLRQQIEAQAAELQAARAETASFRDQLQEAQKRSAVQEQAQKDLQGKCGQLEAQCAQLQARQGELGREHQREVEGLSRESASLRAELQTARAALQDQRGLAEDLRQARDKLDVQTAEAARLRQLHADQSAELAALNQQLQQAQLAPADSLEQQTALEQANDRLAKSADNYARLQAQYRELLEMHAEQTKTLEALQQNQETATEHPLSPAKSDAEVWTALAPSATSAPLSRVVSSDGGMVTARSATPLRSFSSAEPIPLARSFSGVSGYPQFSGVSHVLPHDASATVWQLQPTTSMPMQPPQAPFYSNMPQMSFIPHAQLQAQPTNFWAPAPRRGSSMPPIRTSSAVRGFVQTGVPRPASPELFGIRSDLVAMVPPPPPRRNRFA
eukprot:TRINITY_DN4982_c0_g1_i1.p1 TRINITY_DN4982_c0_g1~~TRINITY_DN4982_c0_g1_i1.p1  ORF type:complete len:1311 (-),score=356.13 TRINITY_DN4982_c0_g1_i1:53-3985(-)